MKRVKIMLMSICLVAVAGGVLAFKARHPQRFCTAATINGACPNFCPSLAQVIVTASGSNIICTAPPVVVGINQNACTFETMGQRQTVTCDGTIRFTSTEW
jgi:hypothetical protein